MNTFFLLVFSTFITSSHSLQCYHCIGKECDDVYTRITRTIDCPQGSFCQVARYQFYDGIMKEARSTSVARGCSLAKGCMNTLGLQSCKEDPIKFMFVGCPTRVCCDTDLCNTDTLKDLE